MSIVMLGKPNGLWGRFLESDLHDVFRQVQEFCASSGAGGTVIGLHVGEPGFEPPEEVAHAIRKSFRNGGARYGDAEGLYSLRSMLAEKVRTENFLPVCPEQVIVTPGSSQALYAVMTALTSPGDEILLPVPYWPIYVQQCAALGLKPRFYYVAPDGNIDVNALALALSQRTRALIVNSPSNPSGAILSVATLNQILDLTAPYQTAIINDEAYEDFAFDTAHVSLGKLETERGDTSRVYSVYTFSKTFALTGLRVGYIVAPNLWAAGMLTRVQEACLVCPSTPAQRGAEAAMSVREQAVKRARQHLEAVRASVLPMLLKAGLLECVPPGGWYAMCRIPESIDDTKQFCAALLRNQGVAVAPGGSFGACATTLGNREVVESASCIRVALCGPLDAVKDGVQRICTAVLGH